MEETEREVKPVDPRRFGDMYDLVVREDGYQGSYEQFVQELMTNLNQLGSRYHDSRTPAERRLDRVKARIDSAHERGYHDRHHPDRAAVKKKKKRRKAVMKQHRR